MKIERIIEGLLKYIDRNILPHMTGLQEAGYLVIGELVRSNPEVINSYINQNFVLRAYLAADKDGNIDIDRLYNALEKVIAKKGMLSFEIPLYGNFRLEPSDLRALFATIKE